VSISVSYYVGKKVYYLTPFVTGITWSGDITEASRSCEISLNNTKNGTTQAIKIELGRSIRLRVDGDEVFRGVVFGTEFSSDGSLRITVRDYNHYLTKNTDSQKFVKMKASEIVKSICKKYGIDYGNIDDTGYVIPKLILRDKTIYDMIVIALTETRQKTGKVFLLTNEKGKLVLRERRKQVKRLLISDGSNILGASMTTSIEDLRNSVRYTGKSGPDAKGVTVSDSDSVKKYGLMREKQDDSEKTDAKLKPIATALLKELNKVATESNVDVIGHKDIFAGTMVQVTEKMTGLSGGFYVVTDSHNFEPSGGHTMSLGISKTLELNEINYEPPEDPKKKSTKSTKSSSSSSSHSSSKASDKAHKVVDLARSYKGKLRYVFGSKNIPNGTGDCSGFTWFIYEHAAGINLGHGTTTQVTKGDRISSDDATIGDLIFFQGTYRPGVSHVGIVTRKGYFVNLQNDGCKEESYTSGYWANHFMQIRRVV
jgi:cell wall-associated NlpC family hydrolase